MRNSKRNSVAQHRTHRGIVRIVASAVIAGAIVLTPAQAQDANALERIQEQMQALQEQIEMQRAQIQAQEERLLEQEAQLLRLRQLSQEVAPEEQPAIVIAPPTPEPPENGLFTSGWDKGFKLRSLDDKFSLQIGGWIQPRYEYTDRSDNPNTSSFRLRRARLEFGGHVFQDTLTYRILPELAGGSVSLRDAWINYEFEPYLQARMGQFTAPFQWHRFVGPRRQHFAERGVPSEALGFWNGRDHGVMLHGRNDANTLAYGWGIFDGAGRNVGISNSDGNMTSGRLTWAALGSVPREESDYSFSEEPNVSLGAGVQAANKNEVRAWDLGRSPTGNQRADWISGTADATLRWRGFSAALDGQLRQVDPDDNAVDSYTGWGYMATTGYFLVPKRYEAVARFSRFRLDRDDAETQETEWGVGLNVYHSGHDWKTRLNFFQHRVSGATDQTVLLEHHLQF